MTDTAVPTPLTLHARTPRTGEALWAVVVRAGGIPIVPGSAYGFAVDAPPGDWRDKRARTYTRREDAQAQLDAETEPLPGGFLSPFPTMVARVVITSPTRVADAPAWLN